MMEDKGFGKPYDRGLCFHKFLRKFFFCFCCFFFLQEDVNILFLKKKLATFKFIYSVHSQVHRCMRATIYVWGQRATWEVSSFLQTCVFQRLNLGCWVRQEVPLLMEPSLRP